MSEAYVATMAKQASDLSGVMAVIDVEPSVPSGALGFTDRTLPALRGEHRIIGSGIDPVVVFQRIVAEPLGVLLTPFARLARNVIQVLSTPRIVLPCHAHLAPLLKPVEGSGARIEVVGRLGHFAMLARLGAGVVDQARGPRLKLLLLCDRARLAVKVEAVFFGSVLMELIERFFGLTGRAFLHGRPPLPFIVYKAFQPVNRSL